MSINMLNNMYESINYQDLQEWLLKLLEETYGLSFIYLLSIQHIFARTLEWVDKSLTDLRPSYVVIATTVILYSLNIILKVWNSFSYAKLLIFIRSLPIIRDIVRKKLDKIGADIRKELTEVYQDEPYISALPKRASSADLLFKKLKHYQMFDTSNWQSGRISGAIYTSNSSQYNDFLLTVYGSSMWSNPLHADVFASIRKMESEIIRMVATMFKGDSNKTLGSVTSGGTESIIMACKAYRDYALKVRGISGVPEIVAPTTAHAAFEKAANILGCKIVKVPIDPKSLKVNMKTMRQAINGNTCMLVGSAPNFPHGIMDPIEQIAKLGVKYRIPVHVDACLGGFLIAFMEATSHTLDERFDFSVHGVTSISADMHKYGYAPKGTSVVLYNDKKYIHQQYSIQTDWPGGMYASPTLPGSRPGGLIATCWAAMLYHGVDSYVEATDKIIKTTRWICDELKKIDGIEVMGRPYVSVVAFKSTKFNIFKLNDLLKSQGWNLNALQFPSALHLCVTLMHTDGKIANTFVRDVASAAKKLQMIQEDDVVDGFEKGSVKITKKHISNTKKNNAAEDEGSAAIYGLAQTIPDRSIVEQVCTRYLDSCLGH